MMYSFDVFDTLITRNTATPKGIFSIMQYHLQHDSRWASIPDHIKNNFYHLRVHAEKFPVSSLEPGIEEVTLDQVYSFFSHTPSVTQKMCVDLMEFEIETELACSVGITANINRVIELISHGIHVVLISDMYLPSTVIRKLLCKHHAIFQDIPIYVSSEIKLRKGTGNLYKYVREKEGIHFSEWMHIGDNPISDVRVPQKLGICAEQYPYTSLLPYESYALKKSPEDPQVQLAIGTSRNIRLQQPDASKPYALGTSLGGALLLPYVRWILQDALARKIRCLYFVARDGYVLKEIADVLIHESGYDISTKYIYGSRIAWGIPSDLESDCFSILSNAYKIERLSDVLDALLCGGGGAKSRVNIQRVS